MFRANCLSTDTFHCQLFGITARGFSAPLGDTCGFTSGEGVPSVRTSVAVISNGAVNANCSNKPTGSRWKNCPPPTRTAVFPSPLTSQAMPTRGAIAWLLLLTKARFVPGVPLDNGKLTPSAASCAAAAAHGEVPGTTMTPLQASEGFAAASVGLQSAWLKLAQSLFPA